MSTTELIQKIESLPLEKRKKLESYIEELLDSPVRKRSFADAADEVFRKHARLLEELSK